MKTETPPKPVAILLIDDDKDDYLILRDLIRKITNPTFLVEWVSDTAQARQRIAEEAHDIYLVDYRLGAENGLELLAEFDVISRPQPFIILTGARDNRVEETAMKAGVADYLVKGTFSVELLARVLRYSLQRKAMETQRIEHMLQLSRSKDEFIGLASHQLRTPATAVKQYLGMLLEGYVGELAGEQRSFVQNAYNSNERQLRIVDNILKIAQLDLQKVTLHQEKVDIGAFVEDIVSEIRPLMAEHQQTITLAAPERPLTGLVDRMYMRMALTNLLDNASKYSEKQTAISVHITANKEGDTCIAITDQGVGIDPADFDKLFIKFSRIHNPLSVKVGGSGLGLYWSNEIIRLHGGRIEVTSKLDEGTCFMVVIPSRSVDGKTKVDETPAKVTH